jgi:hypothetical protein
MFMHDPPGEEDGVAHLAQRFQSERARSQRDAEGFAKRWGRTARIRYHRRSRQQLWMERVSRRMDLVLNCLLVVGGIIMLWIV